VIRDLQVAALDLISTVVEYRPKVAQVTTDTMATASGERRADVVPGEGSRHLHRTVNPLLPVTESIEPDEALSLGEDRGNRRGASHSPIPQSFRALLHGARPRKERPLFLVYGIRRLAPHALELDTEQSLIVHTPPALSAWVLGSYPEGAAPPLPEPSPCITSVIGVE
jgi:hypothetical protein